MDNNQTSTFFVVREELDVHMILERVYEALQEKGYNPVKSDGRIYYVWRSNIHYQSQQCKKHHQ